MRTETLIATAAGLLIVATVLISPSDELRQLLPIMARTGSSAGLAAAAAAVLGAVLAFAYRTGGRTARLLVLCACLPLAFPPAALATALIQEPFALDPYGPGVVIVSQAVGYVPVTFVIQAGALATVSDDLILACASLGISPTAAIRRLFGAPWLRSFGISVILAGIFIASDPSVTLAYGGTDSYLASHMFRSMTTGIGGGLAPAFAALILPAVLVAIYLASAAEDWAAVRNTLQATNPTFVRHYFSRFQWVLFPTALIALGVLSIAAVIGAGAVGVDGAYAGELAGTTLAVLAFTIPAALLVGLATSVFVRRHPRFGLVITALLLLLFLMSQTVVGMAMSGLLRDSTTIGFVTIPSLVGGGSVAGGYIAVGIAYLSVSVPIAHVGMTLILRSAQDLFDAARDAGADGVRAAATVAPVFGPHIVGLVALIAGIVLTRPAPIIFVRPPGFETASTGLTSLAEAGWDERVFAVSAATAAAAVGLLLLVAAGRRLGRKGERV